MADTPQVLVPLQVPIAQSEDSHTQVQVVVFSAPMPNVVAPVVGNFLPAGNASIEATDPIQFDVTDDQGSFARIIVTVTLAGVTEVVHDGSQFRGLYAGLSARTLITNGFRFKVARQGGWTASPTFETFANDLAGQEAV